MKRKKSKRIVIRLLEVVLVTFFSICQILGGVTFASDGGRETVFSAGRESAIAKSVKQVMTENGFSAEDVTEDLADASICLSYWFSNRKYAVEYYEYVDSAAAMEAYNSNTSSFKVNPDLEKLLDIQDGGKTCTAFSDEEMCYFLSYRDCVFLYSEAPIEYENEIRNLLIELEFIPKEGT